MKDKFTNIILNVPHASTEGFYGENSGWPNNANFINHTVLNWTDLFTDFLFFKEDIPNITMVRSNLSRFIVDVERLENDEMEKVGQGIVYTKFNCWNRDLNKVKNTDDLYQYRLNHLNKIKDSISNSDSPILIDCHSFPSNFNNDYDVCIGFNEDWSKPSDEVINLFKDCFVKEHYKVGINVPYSNSISPVVEDKKYPSIMIELNKKTYMNEATHTINANTNFAPKISYCIREIYKNLLDIYN